MRPYYRSIRSFCFSILTIIFRRISNFGHWNSGFLEGSGCFCCGSLKGWNWRREGRGITREGRFWAILGILGDLWLCINRLFYFLVESKAAYWLGRRLSRDASRLCKTMVSGPIPGLVRRRIGHKDDGRSPWPKSNSKRRGKPLSSLLSRHQY